MLTSAFEGPEGRKPFLREVSAAREDCKIPPAFHYLSGKKKGIASSALTIIAFRRVPPPVNVQTFRSVFPRPPANFLPRQYQPTAGCVRTGDRPITGDEKRKVPAGTGAAEGVLPGDGSASRPKATDPHRRLKPFKRIAAEKSVGKLYAVTFRCRECRRFCVVSFPRNKFRLQKWLMPRRRKLKRNRSFM